MGDLPSNNGQDNSNSNRTGLIVGIVLGVVGFLALTGGIITAIIVIKGRAAAGAKPVTRARLTGHPDNNKVLQTRLHTRNPRTVKLAPLNVKPSPLPPSSVNPTTHTTLTTNPSTPSKVRSDLHSPLRGIPLRLEPIRY